MKIKAFKSYFFGSLAGEYSKEETGSFFNILCQHFLRLSRLELALDPEKELSSEELRKLEATLQRLQEHEPVQYITGETEFYGLQFRVDKNVLIPRPETEELVQWVIEDLQNRNKKNLRILDIGTGSGCIAITLAKNLPQAKVSALDVSEGALDLARENASRNEVQVSFLKADILHLDHLQESYDVIVSNPPYVRELEKKEMQRNVLEFEPELALYVENNDPLLFYRKVAELSRNALLAEGTLYFEINQYLGKETQELLEVKNFRTSLKKDIFGVDRMLKAQLS